MSGTLPGQSGNAEVIYKELMHYRQKGLYFNREIHLESGQETGIKVSLRTPAPLRKTI